jgi:hypothetical protein
MAAFVPEPDREATIWLQQGSNERGQKRFLLWVAYTRVDRQYVINQGAEPVWGPMITPGFIHSAKFYYGIGNHLRTIDPGLTDKVISISAGYGGQYIMITLSDNALANQVRENIIEYVENALYSRILGMGAGAGAERYGGRRKTRSKKRSNRKSRKTRSKRRSIRHYRPYR